MHPGGDGGIEGEACKYPLTIPSALKGLHLPGPVVGDISCCIGKSQIIAFSQARNNQQYDLF